MQFHEVLLQHRSRQQFQGTILRHHHPLQTCEVFFDLLMSPVSSSECLLSVQTLSMHVRNPLKGSLLPVPAKRYTNIVIKNFLSDVNLLPTLFLCSLIILRYFSTFSAQLEGSSLISARILISSSDDIRCSFDSRSFSLTALLYCASHLLFSFIIFSCLIFSLSSSSSLQDLEQPLIPSS